MQICLHFIQIGIGLLDIYYCTLILKKKMFSTNRAPQTLGEKLEEETPSPVTMGRSGREGRS